MSVFKRLAGKAKPSAAPASAPPAAQDEVEPVPTDPCYGDPTARRFAGELAEGRWQEFHEFLERDRGWDDRDFYVSTLASIEGRPDWLDEWVSATPGSSIPLLFRGAHGIRWGWQARSAKRSEYVAEDAWKTFFERLVAADRDLDMAAQLDPDDPTPHARAIWSAIGLELGIPEIRRRFGEVVARAPLHLDAHMSMVQALAAKWYGSNDAMFGFAREVAERAPEGHGLHSVVAGAHVERWLDFRKPEEKEQQRNYFLDPAVKEEISRAAAHYLDSASVQVTKYTPAHRNLFAFCFRLMRDYDAQLRQMELIGDAVATFPWEYQGNPGLWYAKHRALANRQVALAAINGQRDEGRRG